MTLTHAHHDDLHGSPGGGRFAMAAAVGRFANALKMLHRGVVVAKMRRLRCELMFHPRHGHDVFSEEDAARIPQTPLILGDKWDF